MVCIGFISVCFLQVPMSVIGALATGMPGNREVPPQNPLFNPLCLLLESGHTA